jgi:hypothetical protein
MIVPARLLLLGAILAGAAASAAAQSMQSREEFVAGLDASQQQEFADAGKAAGEKRYADALALFGRLSKEVPGSAYLAKVTSETALNAGDNTVALALLRPIRQADPDDWQAVGLLARACAQARDAACRDAEISHMAELHRRGLTPGAFQQYKVETVKVGDNSLVISVFLQPAGRYNAYAIGQLFDAGGVSVLRIFLESADFDQPLFAKEHPQEAARGLRSFSLDGYRETSTNGAGQRTETHFTYRFFVGEPKYEALRGDFIDIANGKASVLSSRTNIPAP